MSQNLTQHSPYEDFIDLREIIGTLIESKKLIIFTILIFLITASMYSLSQKPEFKSSTIIEIGHYEMPDGTKKLIEEPSDLISNLKILQLMNAKNEHQNISFKIIENRLIRIESSSNSATDNEKILNSFNDFTVNRHIELLIKSSNLSQNTLLEKIELIDSKIAFITAKQLNEKQLKQSIIEFEIDKFQNELPIINLEISQLEKVITDDLNNLNNLKDTILQLERASISPTLEQIIYSYRSKINDLNTLKNNNILETEKLKNQLKNLENSTLQSDQLFSLRQEQKTLKDELQKLMTQTSVNTNPIGDIQTKTIKPKIITTIILGLILGFISSIFLVLIRYFLKIDK